VCVSVCVCVARTEFLDLSLGLLLLYMMYLYHGSYSSLHYFGDIWLVSLVYHNRFPPHIHFGNSCTMFLYTMPWFLDIGYTFFT